MRKALFFLIFSAAIGLCMLPAQNLTIDYQYNVSGRDTANYLSFSGPHRLVTANRDTFDAVTGASKQKSTALFTAYQTDISGKAAFPGGVRGLFLYPVAPDDLRTSDSLNVTKAANGVITIQYAHRGIAYRIVTDSQGRLTFPRGSYSVRTIGYIQGAGPQVISRDFSSDGTAAGINWNAVWDTRIASGQAIPGNASARTGAVTNDWEDSTIFFWTGTLQFTFESNILKISGSLRATRG
ncbi:MAG: hypothetical protein LBQ61_02745 [Spirochaetales bacterium]|jgi:hypothetical protein|nr:hypothetical protein [Spirochaetales bacterium]